MTEKSTSLKGWVGRAQPNERKNDGLQDEYRDVGFCEVDSQTDVETVEEYGVRKTPTTLVYANDEQKTERNGIVNQNDAEWAIENAAQQTSELAQRLVDAVSG